jgi:hypothetical protein
MDDKAHHDPGTAAGKPEVKAGERFELGCCTVKGQRPFPSTREQCDLAGGTFQPTPCPPEGDKAP